MTNYVVSYDLRKPDRDYTPLLDEIRKSPNWCRPLESFWFVSTSETAAQLHNRLFSKMHSADGLIVVQSGREAAWMGIVPAASDWMKSNL